MSVPKYLIGKTLPPHLSPFVDKNRDQQYVPPEEKALYDPTILEEMYAEDKEEIADENNEQSEDEEEQEEEEEEQTSEKEEVAEEKVTEKVDWKQMSKIPCLIY